MDLQHSIEIFQLLFLRHLGERLPKDHYALKGGCNLRFYQKSIRYSEDIDFDIKTIAKGTLKSNVRKILESQSFIKSLMAKGILISQISEPKQTETTQRWKITLQTSGNEIPIHTKIEFSRRNLDAGTSFEAVDPELIHSYGLYPIYSTHYNKDTAFYQKLHALAQRPETQARDIFDLDLLLTAGATPSLSSGVSLEKLAKAQTNALSVSYADFKSQVLAYLLPKYSLNYSEATWKKIVKKIVHLFEKMKP